MRLRPAVADPEARTPMANSSPPDRLAWYRRMLVIRRFEEKVQELFMGSYIQGTTHLCQGQEAVVMGGQAFRTPPRAVSMPADLLVPYSPPLEDEIIPSADAIAEAARAAVRG